MKDMTMDKCLRTYVSYKYMYELFVVYKKPFCVIAMEVMNELHWTKAIFMEKTGCQGYIYYQIKHYRMNFPDVVVQRFCDKAQVGVLLTKYLTMYSSVLISESAFNTLYKKVMGEL